MPSVESNASWNPAFMPNSTEDTIATKPLEDESSSKFAPEPLLEVSRTEHDAPPSTLDADVEAVEDGNTPEEEEANEAESTPDDVPSTFVASAGVDLNGHNSMAEPETSEDPQASMFESPSKNKHLSTMSFARTVSQDVNWGEDDEVDPEWNLQPAEEDPFEFMPQTKRTNSFPAVPARETHEELPHSQAEQIMNEVEQESEQRDLFAMEGEDPEAAFFTETSAPQKTQLDFVAEGQPDSSEWFPDYGQAYGGHPQEEEAQEQEARFEEGLPLVNHEESQNPHQEQATQQALFMDEEQGDDEEGFFTQASKAEMQS